MAYISGYEGRMTFGGVTSVTNFAPATTDLKIDSWDIRQVTDDFGALALGDAWETGFVTASEWTGSAVFQMQSGLETAGHSGVIRVAGSVAKTFTSAVFVTKTVSGGTEEYTGSGHITNLSTTVTPDAGVQLTVEFAGDGKLVFTGHGA